MRPCLASSQQRSASCKQRRVACLHTTHDTPQMARRAIRRRRVCCFSGSLAGVFVRVFAFCRLHAKRLGRFTFSLGKQREIERGQQRRQRKRCWHASYFSKYQTEFIDIRQKGTRHIWEQLNSEIIFSIFSSILFIAYHSPWFRSDFSEFNTELKINNQISRKLIWFLIIIFYSPFSYINS